MSTSMGPVRASVPTDEEARQALTALESLMECDAATEDKLAALEAKVAEYRRTRQQLQKGIYYYRAIIAPVRLLPIEILGHIFGYLVGSAPDAMFQVSRVCSLWRNASMVSSLWSSIILTSETPAAMQRARIYLQRSNRVPLDVTFVQSAPPHWHWSAWSVLKSSVLRWRSLSLTVDNCQVASREIRSLPAAHDLKELSVAIRGCCTNPDDEGQFGFEPDDTNPVRRDSLAGSPHLQILQLSTFILPFPGSIFVWLRKLSITDSFSTLENPGPNLVPIQGKDLIGLLKYCHNLEEFSFNAEATVSWFVRHPVNGDFGQQEYISLPRLRHLYLHCHYSCVAYMLPCLSVPNLDSASLLMRPRHTASTNGVLERATLEFLKSCQILRTLHILAYRGLAIIAAMILGLPNLESLHLEHSPTPDIVVRALGMCGRFGYFTKQVWLAPKLTTLIIDAEPLLLNHKHIYYLLVRYYNNLTDGTPSPLLSLVVNGRDMLKGVDPGTIAEFERVERFGGQTWEMHQGQPIREPTIYTFAWD